MFTLQLPLGRSSFEENQKEELFQICVDKHDNSESSLKHQSQVLRGWWLLEVLPLPFAHLTQRAQWAVWQSGPRRPGEQQKSEQGFVVFVLLFCSCSMIVV